MKEIKISVSLITYNQEKYIRKCLEGILNQIVDYDFEVLVGQDFSTDGTHEICLEYANKYPNLIRYYPRENNLGMNRNWIQTLSQCKGQYIAICEGDDYWTDPYKLQKQVDFLEANPEYVLCFHKVKILKPDGFLVDDFITKVPEHYETIETLARLGNYIHTPSVVFRNIIKEFPKEFIFSPIGDYFIYMLLAEHGKLKYLKDEMAVYRDGVGIWSTHSNYSRNLKTANTHSLIVSALSNNEFIKNILKDRVLDFFNKFQTEIKPDDLLLLNTCSFMEKAIYTFLLYNKFTNKKLEKYTAIDLIREVLKRIKKKIFK
jgi:glycosyltransferase involved in cell wall biosynthesis